MTNVSLGSIGVAVDNAVVKSVQCEPQLLSERYTKKQKKIQKINLKRIREIFNPRIIGASIRERTGNRHWFLTEESVKIWWKSGGNPVKRD